MKVIIAKDYEEMSRKAASILAAQVALKPDSVLGLATGSSPIGLYKNLVRWHKEEGLDFSAISTVNLDEYVGLPKEHDQSYRYFMNDNLFAHVNIDPANVNFPDAMAEDVEKACEEYNAVLESFGGADLQLLGLGHNGHIGFNEPADDFCKKVHVTELTDSTIDANKRFFASREEVPTRAVTMGIGNIMKAKKIVVVVSGADKAAILKASICGPVTPAVPASILQFHPDVTFVVDEAAASEL